MTIDAFDAERFAKNDIILQHLTIGLQIYNSLVIKNGDTLIINQGTTVNANHILNQGTIVNHGILETSFLRDLVNDGGIIDAYGATNIQQGEVYNVNGGIINVKEGGNLVVPRSSSAVPGSIENEGTINKECNTTFGVTGTFSGNAVVDKCLLT